VNVRALCSTHPPRVRVGVPAHLGCRCNGRGQSL